MAHGLDVTFPLIKGSTGLRPMHETREGTNTTQTRPKGERQTEKSICKGWDPCKSYNHLQQWNPSNGSKQGFRWNRHVKSRTRAATGRSIRKAPDCLAFACPEPRAVGHGAAVFSRGTHPARCGTELDPRRRPLHS